MNWFRERSGGYINLDQVAAIYEEDGGWLVQYSSGLRRTLGSDDYEDLAELLLSPENEALKKAT